jgi:hypothetical protein
MVASRSPPQPRDRMRLLAFAVSGSGMHVRIGRCDVVNACSTFVSMPIPIA